MSIQICTSRSPDDSHKALSTVLYLLCWQVRSTDEVLNNLSVEVYQNTSITHCLRCYFTTETISAENKVHCDNCASLQVSWKGEVSDGSAVVQVRKHMLSTPDHMSTLKDVSLALLITRMP